MGVMVTELCEKIVGDKVIVIVLVLRSICLD